MWLCCDFRGVLRDERGSTLIVALAVLTLLAVVGGTFLTLSRTEGGIALNQEKGTVALYLTESGIHAALAEFTASGFQSWTHAGDGSILGDGTMVSRVFEGEGLIRDDSADNGLHDERNDGWFVWEWTPGDSGSGMTQTGLPESVRLSLRPASPAPDEDKFIIDAIGAVGKFRRHIQVLGIVEPLFTHSLFSDGDLSEFTLGVDQQVYGKIHANGDMYFAPLGTRLTIHSPSVTAVGRMFRTRDAWGQPVSGFEEVKIQGTAGITEMVGGPVGTAMDSENPDWANDDPDDGIDGAMDLWGGVVRDGSIGVNRVEVPPVEMFYPGGFYDVNAAIRVRAGDVQVDNSGNDISVAVGSAIREVTFWNPSIEEYVTVQEIDLAELDQIGLFPANGLLYSEVPLRLTNSNQLASDLTVVANHSIYTKGDYNAQNKRAAAIMSTGRIWHLSDAWQDDDAVTRGPVSGRQAANGTTNVNAALLDGQPIVNEANFADLDGDGSPDDPTAGDAQANSDRLLEAWGAARILKTRGSVAHLVFADMADELDNSGMASNEVAWIKHSAYTSPHRDSMFDNSLAGMSGQPPFWPRIARVYRWQEITP
jgi:hypothetical protein